MAIAAALAAGWFGLIVLAPLLPPPAAGLLYLFGSRICHQLSDRSFHIDGAQLPVCARCLGAYAGAAAAAVVCAVRRAPSRVRGASVTGVLPGMGVGFARLASPSQWLIAAAALNLATALVEWAGVWEPSNPVRAAAGALLGSATALVVGHGLWGPAGRRGPGLGDPARTISPESFRPGEDGSVK